MKKTCTNIEYDSTCVSTRQPVLHHQVGVLRPQLIRKHPLGLDRPIPLEIGSDRAARAAAGTPVTRILAA